MDHISVSIISMLRKGVEKGYWTEDHLDTPSPGRRLLEQEMKRHKVYELRSFKLPPHRNLLRPDPEPIIEPEPGVELDGVTVYTQDSPIPADLSPDSLGF